MTNYLQTVKYTGEAVDGLEDQPVGNIAEMKQPSDVDEDFISSDSSDSDSEDGIVDSGMNSQGQAKKGTARSRKTPKKQTPKKQSNKNTPQPSPTKRSTLRKPQTPQNTVTPRKGQTPRSTKTQSQSQRKGRAAGLGNKSTANPGTAKEAATTPTKIKGKGEDKAPQPEEDHQGEDVGEEGIQDQPQPADTETTSSQPRPSLQASADQVLNTQMLGQDEGKLSSNRNSPDPTVTPRDNTSRHSSLTPLSRTPSPVMELFPASTNTTGSTASSTEQ